MHALQPYTSCAARLCKTSGLFLPEKDVVTLVVKGDSSPALEIGILAEDGGKHAPQAVPKPRSKVVQYQLWSV